MMLELNEYGENVNKPKLKVELTNFRMYGSTRTIHRNVYITKCEVSSG
ncbi:MULTISPECIES: hypothetical protein [unclassified Bacillus (in: firmicutes)]|nr:MULTISPECIES: hypothetical protein [unclassified Bacillus (in: firmicutes)]MBT2613919.1 hypothetical protein [Bacillus sp. ISL-78]MBT2627798.1 hypothetical protein [Bacillus sp. ISL-101]